MSDTHIPVEELKAHSTGNVFHGAVTSGENGTVSAFGGDQHNYGDTFYLSISALRRRVGYAADTESVDREMRSVVAPPHLDQHLETMRERQILVLTGGAHTGLSTAAAHRWRAFAAKRGGGDSRELFPSEPDELLDEITHLKEPQVLLLDLSHDPVLGTRITERFPQLQAALREQRSHLVIALGDDCHQAAVTALPNAVHRIGRPDPFAVLAKRMRQVELLERMRPDRRFQSLIADAWPPKAARIAELLDQSPPGVDASRLISTVQERLRDRKEQLSTHFEQKFKSARSRALLLATSAIEGGGRDVISFAATDLIAIAAPSPLMGPSLLEEQSLRQRFGELESVLQPGAGRFNEAGYGEAVLPFVWDQFPAWREPIQEWLDLLLEPQRLEDDALAILLPRLLSFAAATGAAELVTIRAARIVGESGGWAKYRRELAAGLLLAGATDEVIGPEVRRQLWYWSYRNAVPIALQRTIAAVCGDPDYALRFPRNALTRLKHLMKADAESVRLAAIEAITAVARSVTPQLMIEQLTEWVSQKSDPALRELVPMLLVVLLEDELVCARWSGSWLARDPSGSVETLWRSILVYALPEAVRDGVAAWLALAAASPPDHRFPLADRLASAAADHYWMLGQLSQALSDRAWSERNADNAVLALRDRLTAHLAQAKVSL